MAVRAALILLTLGLVSCKREPAPIAVAPAQPDLAGQTAAAQQEPEAPQQIDPADQGIRDAGIEALEAGRFEEARRIFAGLLDRYPNDTELADYHQRAVDGDARRRAERERLTPKELPAIRFGRHTVRDAPVSQAAKPPKLVLKSRQPNDITDDERWFSEHGLRLPTWTIPNPNTGVQGNLPEFIPTRIEQDIIVRAIDDGDHAIALYGPDYSGGRIAVVFDAQGSMFGSFDFSAWAHSPKDVPRDISFTEQRVNWALVRHGVLFVSTGHRTYAKSSGGLNAFITAIDLQSGDVLWRSDPLVANAVNFIYRDGFLITGYGFTAEPDFLFVLDAKNGKTVSKTKVKSGPSYVLEKEGRLMVRTYDTDSVYEVR